MAAGRRPDCKCSRTDTPRAKKPAADAETGLTNRAIRAKIHLAVVQMDGANATVAQLVEQLIRNQQVAGSSPASSSTSEQASYRLLRLFLSKKSERTHSAAPPLQMRPADAGLAFGGT